MYLDCLQVVYYMHQLTQKRLMRVHSRSLVLGMHTNCNSTKNQPHTQPCLLRNHLALDVPFTKNGKKESTRIDEWDGKG